MRRRVEREPGQGCRSTAGASRPFLAEVGKAGTNVARTVAAASTSAATACHRTAECRFPRNRAASGAARLGATARLLLSDRRPVHATQGSSAGRCDRLRSERTRRVPQRRIVRSHRAVSARHRSSDTQTNRPAQNLASDLPIRCRGRYGRSRPASHRSGQSAEPRPTARPTAPRHWGRMSVRNSQRSTRYRRRVAAGRESARARARA